MQKTVLLFALLAVSGVAQARQYATDPRVYCTQVAGYIEGASNAIQQHLPLVAAAYLNEGDKRRYGDAISYTIRALDRAGVKNTDPNYSKWAYIVCFEKLKPQ